MFEELFDPRLFHVAIVCVPILLNTTINQSGSRCRLTARRSWFDSRLRLDCVCVWYSQSLLLGLPVVVNVSVAGCLYVLACDEVRISPADSQVKENFNL